MYFVIALIALGVLIIIHELGHFIMARINDVKVDEFAIGMGPKLFGIQGKETQYSIRILPIGGYVKMNGEYEDSNDERSLMRKTPLQRISITIAGPIMNLLLPIIIYTIIAMNSGYVTNEIKGILPNSPAESAKILPGDKIVKINDKKINTWEDLSMEIYTSKDLTLKLEVDRNNSIKEIKLTPQLNTEENRYMIGIEPVKNTNPSFGQSIVYGLQETKSVIKQTFSALKTLVTGKASLKTDVGGPVSIIKISGAAARAGMISLLTLVAYISIQLAIFNLIPFPALDGGWTLLLLIELISGKKINKNIVEKINTVGFSILIAIMLLVTVKDILFPIKL